MDRNSNPLINVERHNLCAGCGLCEGLLGSECIEVKLDNKGYLRPEQHKDLTHNESLMLSSVCPGLNVKHNEINNNYDAVWGPICSIHVAAASDTEVRHLASSGGVLSAIQIYLLETGKVDYILGTSVADDNPFNTKINICRTREDVLRCAGSRYAPSAPLKNISAHLDSPGRFAFVGKPCDVAALRRLSNIDKRVNDKVLFYLSFMCAGVPSQLGTNSIVDKLGIQESEVENFRYRGDGWPGLTKATLTDGTTRSMDYEKSWGNILSQYVQWRCKLCPDGTGEFADIACADAWNLHSNGTPDFTEQDGKSFIIIRTSVGRDIINQCVNDNAITVYSKVDSEHLQSVQFHQSYRRRTMLVRYLAMACINRTYPQFNITALLASSSKIGIWPLFRAFIGSIKRGIHSIF